MRDHVRSGTEAVDGLRGIAILLVLFYHTFLFSWLTPAFSAFGRSLPVDVLARDGYLGVDLFFAISGFVLFFPHALARLGAPAHVETTREFAFRRFVKIVPSYALALVATMVASAEFLGPRPLLVNLATHATFLQNAFPDGLGRANSVFWSLAIEVQFYLVFPLLARAFVRFPLPTAAAMIASALAYRIATAFCCLYRETIVRELPAYLDLFACGMLAAYAVARMRVRPLRLPPRAFTVVACLCGWGAFALMQSADGVQYVPLGAQGWDIVGRTEVALAAGALIASACLAERWFRAVLANPALVFLSIVSYNVYLWHTLLMIWMWKHGVPPAVTANPHDDPHWKLVFIALGWPATFVVAIAVTYFFERPLLGLVRPQRFAFDWSRVARRLPALSRSKAAVRSETRT